MGELDALDGAEGLGWAHHVLLTAGDGSKDVLVGADPLFDALAMGPVYSR